MIISLFLALALQDAAPAQDRDYDACIAEVEREPGRGYSTAARWAANSGDPAAQHCLALAEIALGKKTTGARRLRALAEHEAGDPGLRGRLLVQAIDAFLSADLPREAEEAADAALAIAPTSFAVNTAAAKAFATTGRWGRVVETVDAADADGRAAAGLIILRGRALQALGDYERALEDVIEAISRDPENIDALVLRGELLQATRAPTR